MSKSADEMLDRLRDTRDERMAILDDERAVDNHKLGQQIDRAAGELPEGYRITIELEQGAGWIELTDPEGTIIATNDGDGAFANQLEELIDQAITDSKGVAE